MPLSHITDWIFDLDNTLYRGDVAFWALMDKKITTYISRYLALQPTKARILQKQYFTEYGTSLSGLMAVHGMDPTNFLDYVHDVDLSILKPDPRLREGLLALPGRKFIFTNGSRGHAKNVGEHLNVYDLFDGIFAIEDADYTPKPQKSPYEKFIKKYDIDPKFAFMAEDSARNLEIPKAMGMVTLLVTSDEDWSHEPAATCPVSGRNIPPFVDIHTDDLPGCLLAFISNCPLAP
ncbi:MAG: pyrimidine 5'-nucleotidase [Robiginitomaculum sp.]